MIDIILSQIKKIVPKSVFKLIQPLYHHALALLSAFIYGYPSEKMIVIGVTGTAGKSSTCYFISQILESCGFRVGMTTTTLFKIGAKEWLNDRKMTMLGRFQTQKFLKDMIKAGCQVAIIETSSQGIEQFRHVGINYDVLVFTNLYPEHIEAHGGFENYKKAKGKLFAYLMTTTPKKQLTELKIEIKKTIIVNLDNEYAEYFLGFPADEKMGYMVANKTIASSRYQLASISADNIHQKNNFISADIQHSIFNIPLLGIYNIYNVLAAICVAKVFYLEKTQIKNAVEKLKPLPGRMEFIENNRNLKIIVDYAFEPKALTNLYQTIKDLPHKKIIHILGSTGGGRDKARRPVLGRIAAENADLIIVTNEDPYDEQPEQIINEVAAGAEELIDSKQKNKVLKILDRREAINQALLLAEPGDLVLITGKGAEQAICIADGKKISWDDRKVVKELI